MKYLFFLCIFNVSVCVSAQNLDHDTILIGKTSPYIDVLIKQKEYIYPIFGSPNGIVHPKDGQHANKPTILLKSDSSLYLTFTGTGRMYKMISNTPSGYIYKRIDSTHNINYNLSAYYFTYKGDIYCFGGYGFWKNNGILKVFTEATNEWNVIPLNREVIPQNFPVLNCWYNPTEEKLYVLYHCPTNAGIKGDDNLIGQIKNDVEVLDLKTNTWQKLGETRKNIVEMFKDFIGVYHHSKGIMVLNYSKLYNFDISNNKVWSLKDEIAIQRLMRIPADKNIYVAHNHLIYYDVNSNKYDSVYLDPAKFEEETYPIWEKPLSPFLFMAPGMLLMAGAVFLFKQRRKNRKPIDVEPKEKSYRIQYNDTELALLRLLMEKSKKGRTATIAEINYVLGVKDKNTGLQKKVRSDVFNSVNEKYKFYTGINESLIQSIRSEEDKRFLEYMISADHLTDLHAMLDKT